MNVVELCGLSRSAGGMYYAVSALCNALHLLGTDLVVYGKDDSFVLEDVSGWSPVATTTYPTFGPLQSSLKLRKLLCNRNPEIIHQHGLWMDDQWAALQWQNKTKRPVVISPHGMLDLWALKNSAWKKKLVGGLFANESLKKASCVHALCHSEAESIRAYGLKNPIAIIPNGVNLPVGIGNETQTDQRKKLLFLGRIHPKKGLSELVSGWADARKQNLGAFSQWQLIIAGWDDGGHLKGVRELATKLGLSWVDTTNNESQDGDILFVGPQFGDAKDKLFREVDMFILPSFSEGLPVSVLEAWSYGLPVMMTEYCNLTEGFMADAAIKIEPKAGSISKGLKRVMSMSGAELKDIGQEGRALVEKKFTWDKIAKEMKELYEWCLGGKKPQCMVDYVLDGKRE